MSIFYPDIDVKRIYDIPASFFTERGVRLLFLDVDNTLTTHNNPVPHEKILNWLEEQRRAGLRLMILSNNHEARVAPFAQGLGLEYLSDAAKPLPGRVRRMLRELGMRSDEAALIGDQIFTDVLCGRLTGCLTILVEPMEPEGFGFFKIKRALEKGILRRYRKGRTP